MAPQQDAAVAGWGEVYGFVRRYAKQLGAAAAVIVLALLVIIDHSGAPPTVDEAVGNGVVAAGTVGLTTTGDARVHAVPGTVKVSVDGAGLAAVTVRLTSVSDQPLVIAGSAKLLASQTGLVAGFASGGVTVPAHGTAVLELSGSPPLATVGSIQLDLQATVPPPPG